MFLEVEDRWNLMSETKNSKNYCWMKYLLLINEYIK